MSIPLKTSHSQLQVWSTCEQKWYYNYDLGYVPKKKAEYFSVGTFVHSGLEVVYRARREGKSWDESIILLIKWMKENAATMMAENVSAFNRATRILKRYTTQFAPKADAGIRILDVELHFEVEIPTPKGNIVVVEGYIDLLVEVNGILFLWDHKTIGSSSFWTAEEAMLDPQFGIYTLAMRMQGYNVKGFIVNQMNTYDYKNFEDEPEEKIFRRLETYRTDAHLEAIGLNVGRMADELIAKREGSGEYIRHLSKTTCKGCVYKTPCLYQMKGINVDNLLEQDYVKRERREAIEPVTEDTVEDMSQYALKF